MYTILLQDFYWINLWWKYNVNVHHAIQDFYRTRYPPLSIAWRNSKLYKISMGCVIRDSLSGGGTASCTRFLWAVLFVTPFQVVVQQAVQDFYGLYHSWLPFRWWYSTPFNLSVARSARYSTFLPHTLFVSHCHTEGHHALEDTTGNEQDNSQYVVMCRVQSCSNLVSSRTCQDFHLRPYTSSWHKKKPVTDVSSGRERDV